jgi:chemotaxis protein MotB
MALPVRRRGDNGLSPWPGYVDALSTLLMVIIFVLLVFVLAQAFLSVVISGRDKQLDRVNRQLAEVSDMLSLERSHGTDLQQSIAQLNRELASANTTRETLSQQYSVLKGQVDRATAARDTLRHERDKLAQQLTDANLQAQSGAARVTQLQKDVAASASRTDAAQQETAQVATQLAASKAQLADMQKQIAELDKTVQVGKDTIAARLSDLAKMAQQNRALAALRDDLEKQAQDAAARAMTDAQRRAAVEAQLVQEKQLGDSAAAQIALLTQQVDQLRSQLTSVANALDLAQAQGHEKDTKISDLGQRLNVALAAKVEELQQYRSDFFGKLRAVLANRPGIRIVGDRFVFQSEVLFPLGSADMTPAGQNEITALAVTIKDIAAEIPPGTQWILRVDGHTDRQPIKGGQFTSNWELSSARAITVVKLLIADGVPAGNLAATAFGDNQPLDNADTPEAYAKNRRIELRLTDR